MDDITKIQKILDVVNQKLKVEVNDDIDGFSVYDYLGFPVGDIVNAAYEEEPEIINGYCACGFRWESGGYFNTPVYNDFEIACCPTVEQAAKAFVLYYISDIIDNTISYSIYEAYD